MCLNSSSWSPEKKKIVKGWNSVACGSGFSPPSMQATHLPSCLSWNPSSLYNRRKHENKTNATTPAFLSSCRCCVKSTAQQTSSQNTLLMCHWKDRGLHTYRSWEILSLQNNKNSVRVWLWLVRRQFSFAPCSRRLMWTFAVDNNPVIIN